MRFTYSSGQRVLDGYTLKRGIGRGGFGEVFYAVSDGGKEVALKLVRGTNLDTELRGMAQCLNLKHPNLLTLFDLRTDAQGDHWVIMEYISGEPLVAVLNRHPQGLPGDLTQQWFLEMARAVAHLHGHGIVHRDLKPGNIFLENGTVKVGDYGLSKFISSSQHTAQTQSVGTVHYMAPEISTGNYNKQIDVYAAGVILYEMLTGRVPFDGESAGEILMKHLTSPPDLSKVPAEYVPVVGKALAKNPAHRYPSMADMARAVEAVAGGVRAPAAPPLPESRPAVSAPVEATPPTAIPVAPVSVRGRVGELCGSLVAATFLAALACTVWLAILGGNFTEVSGGFFVTLAACWAVLIPAKVWNGHKGDSGTRRVIMMTLGVLIGFCALWLEHGTVGLAPGDRELWVGPPDGSQTLRFFPSRQGLPLAAAYLSYFGLAFFALRWWKLADRQRAQRFSFAPVLAAGFWTIVLFLLVWPKSQEPLGIIPVLLTSVIVQVVSPWEPPPPPSPKRMRLRYT
jgi:hypothetical protein